MHPDAPHRGRTPPGPSGRSASVVDVNTGAVRAISPPSTGSICRRYPTGTRSTSANSRAEPRELSGLATRFCAMEQTAVGCAHRPAQADQCGRRFISETRTCAAGPWGMPVSIRSVKQSRGSGPPANRSLKFQIIRCSWDKAHTDRSARRQRSAPPGHPVPGVQARSTVRTSPSFQARTGSYPAAPNHRRRSHPSPAPTSWG